ncbi:MAG: UTP--glucose-1-phosphate uridylyltransferase [Bdellovibrio sp. CG12_big_fil_rev_8_21_14_0_65_39_13]|nr:MAG: UTP--glucose-1-phosphate uridylyltransferase [Bdellovibrio sp. CG22_combo_CG10-13_8_21_14_all_39_27]PIQ60713.1 MAG: UTP--glucose-1-phosphate uridylyltransferase [Bdellovibrio sp. CG12_big_fil_rev_8_21_14_0_65_39_13]PIR36337.1 MAG: UTP--glucose-1-phosphate uridylyltransferase [Bdellovibrio sp. CG11_big_fil_rev_8_21_14_0_20_39_38]
MHIKKAVIPVAGKGTRFLPATKETPKEMLPILNYPMIHYVVEEAVLSGIEQIVFITSTGKESIENYFDKNQALEQFLVANKKEKELEMIRKISSMIEITTIRQKEQLGLGHAVLCASSMMGNEDFAVILGDDLVRSSVPVTKQLIDIKDKYKSDAVIGVMEVPKEETDKYGIIEGAAIDNSKSYKMTNMIEKPKPSDAPTNLATPGRYIFSGEIFEYLKKIPRGIGGEYQLTDAICMMAKEKNVLAHIFDGDRYDTGNVKGYLNATIAFALENKELRNYTLEIMRGYLEKSNS